MEETGGTRRSRTGDPIKNYYPRIIDDALFNKVQAATKGRATTRGRVGHDVANLFTGLLVDARDGRLFWIRSTSPNGADYETRKARRTRYLINSAAVSGEGSGNGQPPCRLTFPYSVFEAAFLAAVEELDITPMADGNDDDTSALTALIDEQAEVISRITATKNRLASRERGLKVDALLDLLVDLEQQRDALNVQIDTAKLNVNGHAERVLKDTRDFIEQLDSAKGADRIDLRERIRGRIKALVDRIWVLMWQGEKARHLLAQIHFCNGSVRVMHIDNQWDGRTLKNIPMAPERDLRNYRENPWILDEVAV
jgi:hypothetical protein